MQTLWPHRDTVGGKEDEAEQGARQKQSVSRTQRGQCLAREEPCGKGARGQRAPQATRANSLTPLHKATAAPGGIHRRVGSRTRGVSLPLSSGLIRSQLELCVQAWAPRFREDVETLARVIQGLGTRPRAVAPVEPALLAGPAPGSNGSRVEGLVSHGRPSPQLACTARPGLLDAAWLRPALAQLSRHTRLDNLMKPAPARR